jgi:hypothetical protein
MNVATTSTAALDEDSRLTRSLVIQAKRLDDLTEQHGSELLGVQGSFVSRFENLERAVAELCARDHHLTWPDP